MHQGYKLKIFVLIRSAALVARSRAARGGSNDKFRQNYNTTQRNMLFYKLNVLSCERMKLSNYQRKLKQRRTRANDITN